MTRPLAPRRGLPRRPVLAPGLAVLQRRAAELQIGITERHRLRVADTPAIRRTLAGLARGEAPRTDLETRRALAQLAPVLRDGDTLVHPGIPASEVAAVSLLHPGSATDRLRARRGSRIAVVGTLTPESPVDPVALLRTAGLGIVDDDGTEQPDVVLLLCCGVLDREVTDRLARDHTPYLVVEAVESEIVLGPFVVPGRTACVRCLDAHRTAADAAHRALITAEPQTVRRDGVAAPVHAAMALMALGWAVADLVRYVEGDRPASWSATVPFSPGRPTISPTPWLRHPACGCSWTGVGAWASDDPPNW